MSAKEIDKLVGISADEILKSDADIYDILELLGSYQA